MIDEWRKGAKYWDHAWNPVIGCRKISEGCRNCYAARLAERFPELQDVDGGFSPHPAKHLHNPPKSGVVFVGNMTDIFGEWNSDSEISGWLDRLDTRTPNLILTKRVSRMVEHLSRYGWRQALYGMTAENQARYDERISDFKTLSNQMPRWLSAEPLIGKIDMLSPYVSPEDLPFDWVVVGAESGASRRPCKLEWVELIVRQCRDAGIPVFVKQLDIGGELVADIKKFPSELQIRQMFGKW